MKLSHCIFALLAVAGASQAATPKYNLSDIPAQTSPVRQLVFDKNSYGSKYYRIPALVTAKDGSILAVADKRIETQADLPGKIDVVARRSTDGGRTWSEPVTVAANDSIGGYGDPAVVVDQRTGDILVISAHGNGLWMKSPAHISVSRSKDNGLTWLPAVDINPQIIKSIPDGGDAYEAWFASSGRAVQLKSGRIMFALVTRKPGVDGFPVYAVYSDNGGKTWQVSKNAASLNGDEAKIVELEPNKLIMSLRSRYGGPREFSYSNDGGATWSEPELKADLPDPRCNGDIIRYNQGGYDVLLQSMPGSPTSRDNVTVWVSSDGGKTWPHRHRIVRAPSAYSSMTILPDGKIGFLIEEEVAEQESIHPGYRLWFTALPIEEILK